MRRQKRVTIGLPLVSRSNPGGAAFANCILGVALAKLRKRDSTCRVSRLSLTTPASGMKALAQIGAWHNSLDWMPDVILVSPLLNYFFLTCILSFFFRPDCYGKKNNNKEKNKTCSDCLQIS